MKCRRCGSDRLEGEFRERKNRSGKLDRISTCIFCEREQKNAAEKKRYASFTKEQREEHNRRGREQRQKDSYKQWHRGWQKRREQEDVSFRLKRRVSSLMRNSLDKQGRRFQEVLGYSPDELRAHLEAQFEPWMNWDNWGTYDPSTWDDENSETWTWQIDHIIPVDSFQYETLGDDGFKKCWALENLRPLSAKENLLKGAKI